MNRSGPARAADFGYRTRAPVRTDRERSAIRRVAPP